MIESLYQYISDPENAEYNYSVAREYHLDSQTAAAISFYLRSAERTEDKLLAYECLLHMYFCFKEQANRCYTEKGLLERAITILPKRPEAYFLLSRYYEWRSQYAEAYTTSEIALAICDFDCEPLRSSVEYDGKQSLIFEKAVSSWWWGNNLESRKLFKLLVDEYWDSMNPVHQKCVEDNISRLGITQYSQSQILYSKDKYNSLRYKFKNCENINENYAQVFQDMFVLSMLDGKNNGTFLEIGGANPFYRNNTALLEQKFGWTGVSIEYNDDFANEYTRERPKTKLLHTDATKLDYRELLRSNFEDKVVDYLQLDIEPAKNTYDVLLSIPFDEYKFAVITYEHDYYVDVTKSYREKSRSYLQSLGYELVVNDISPDGQSTFEDWWIHPDLIESRILNVMKDVNDEIKNVEEYMYPTNLSNNIQVIDYFRFFNEKELLELRYNVLKDKVDKFVIVQGTKTFSGNPTELLAQKYIKELNLPEDKFIVINIDLPDNDEDIINDEVDIIFRSFSGPSTDTYKNSLNTRTRERMVMDGLTHILPLFNDEDIFLVSDCDEIIDPNYIDDVIAAVKNNPDKLIKVPLVELQGKANLRVYDTSNNTNVVIDHVFYSCTKKHFNVCSPTQLRYNIHNPFETIKFTQESNSNNEYGWHFSWMGDSNRKKLKCKSFAHYSDLIETAVVKDLASSEMDSFFDVWKPEVGGINPWGNVNLILKEYEDYNLPKALWKLDTVKEFLLGEDYVMLPKEDRLLDVYLKGNYDTDKYELGYLTEFYDEALYSLRNTPINMLEIGTYKGGSAKLWRDYFHIESNISTGDIMNHPHSKVSGVNYILGDMYSDEIVSNFRDNYFDLIIDDGPHSFESFELVLNKYFSKLKPNGTLIIEDVIDSKFVSPLVMLAKEIGYCSYTFIDMSGKQINPEWRENWKSGLYILRFDK